MKETNCPSLKFVISVSISTSTTFLVGTSSWEGIYLREKSLSLMQHNSSNSIVNRHHLSSDSESGINAKFILDIDKLSPNKAHQVSGF
jgi:hypothetical protein